MNGFATWALYVYQILLYHEKQLNNNLNMIIVLPNTCIDTFVHYAKDLRD